MTAENDKEESNRSRADGERESERASERARGEENGGEKIPQVVKRPVNR